MRLVGVSIYGVVLSYGVAEDVIDSWESGIVDSLNDGCAVYLLCPKGKRTGGHE
jgi:hypothetical protein